MQIKNSTVIFIDGYIANRLLNKNFNGSQIFTMPETHAIRPAYQKSIIVPITKNIR